MCQWTEINILPSVGPLCRKYVSPFVALFANKQFLRIAQIRQYFLIFYLIYDEFPAIFNFSPIFTTPFLRTSMVSIKFYNAICERGRPLFDDLCGPHNGL